MDDTWSMSDRDAYLLENIRYLVGMMPSIAAAARKTGINRQQLNKYLNGSSQPSLRTMRRFAETFDLAIEDLTLPPSELIQKMQKTQTHRQSDPIQSLSGDFLDLAMSSGDALKKYCGYYYRYYTPPVLPDQILRSYAVIFQKNGLTFARIVERFADAGTPWCISQVRRSLHLISFIQDRIQFVECKSMRDGKVSPSFSIFYPSYVSGVQFLSGFMLGSFAFGQRPIFSSSIVLKRLPVKHVRRGDLLNCGLLPVGSPELNPEVTHRLCGGRDAHPIVHLAQ